MATVTSELRGKSNNDSENNIEISKCWKSLHPLSGTSPAGRNPGPLSGRPCVRWADCCSPPPPHAASPVAPVRSSTVPLPGTHCCAQTPCAHPWSGEHLWEKGFRSESLKLLMCSLHFFFWEIKREPLLKLKKQVVLAVLDLISSFWIP